MKKYILLLLVISCCLPIAVEAANDDLIWSYSKENQYRVPRSWDVESIGIEESAYTNVLRVIDEINRANGDPKRYVLNNGRVPEITDDVDIVPIWVDELKPYSYSASMVSPTRYYKTDSLFDLLDNTKNYKELNDFSNYFIQQNMRYYFGNGNTVKDLIIEKKSKFADTLSNLQKEGQEKYLIDGRYENYDSTDLFNTLKITSQEYKEHFLDSNGKKLSFHDPKLLDFIKQRIKTVKGFDVTVKDGELWTQAADGKLHRVLWNTDPVSRPEFPSLTVFGFLQKGLEEQGIASEVKGDQLLIKGADGKSNVALWKIVPKTSDFATDSDLETFLANVHTGNPTVTKINDHTLRVELGGKSVDIEIQTAEGKVKDVSWYKNTLLTQLHIYKDLIDRGKILYTKDGGIIIENVADTSNLDPKIKSGYSEVSLTPSNVTNVEKIYFQMIDDYADMQENKMTEEDFKKKWDFAENNTSFHTKLNPLVGKNKDLQEGEEKIAEVKESMANYSGYDYNTWTYHDLYPDYFESGDATKRAAIYNGTDVKAQEYMTDKSLSLSEFQALLDDTETTLTNVAGLETEIDTAMTTAGFERIANSDVIVNNYGKTVEFRGRGRVEGTIDFGEGDNRLKITEQATGRYGTNIVFGPYVKLKNISYIAIGGQYTASAGGVGISGKSSLSIEIDPNKLNNDGRLYQHALKDTWTDGNRIVLKSYGDDPINRDEFAIEMKVSSLGKDVEVDMGRPLVYKAKAFHPHHVWGPGNIDVGDILEYRTNFYSDSIAHQLVLVDEGDEVKKKNGIIKVHLKNSLLRLNGEENNVFRSMVKSGNIGCLSPTLTTSNKKTQFGSTAEEDKFEEQKIMNLVAAMVEQKKPADVLRLSSHLEISEDRLDSLKKNVENIEKDEDVVKAKNQVKTLEKYKKIDTTSTIEDLENTVKDFKSIIPPDGIGYAIKDRVVQKIYEKYGTVDKVEEEIERLKNYAEHFNDILQKFEDAKPSNADDEVVTGDAGWSAKKIGENIRNHLGDLKNVPDDWSSEIERKRALELAYYIVKYRDAKKDLLDLKDMTNDDIYKHIVKELEFDAGRKEGAGPDWMSVITSIFYTQRQEESLKELKILIKQIQDKNIYAKINKISKDEIDVFTPLVIDARFDFDSKEAQVRGGAVSGRFARDEFKGDIYTGYGSYEAPIKDNLSLGFVMGGGSSDFHEIVNDDNSTVTTNSKIKGSRVYLGGFGRYGFKQNINWINGLGVQAASYDIDRDMKNHYQHEKYKGEVKTYTGTFYSGLLYTYNLNDSLNLKFKTGIAYTMVSQDKVKEKNSPLSMEVKSQNFHYLDGQVEVGLAKTIRGDKLNSSLSGMLSTKYGFVGYDNDNLKGRFNGSSSDFDIQGESYKKTSVNLKLDYNVIYDAGFHYGLEGNYTQNGNEDNISIGAKVGYSF
ncbi:MAG: hypothetical protein CSA18_02090 [Deltaproteobacteria bacterium]|nr:MAG: hypothetical protein CSB21_01375 [Deltaproteobacteria bacterium]PIE74927.1 MAG: hypothetical protein CSA18_02090 [Deltaproteobacteria bacterium]